MSDSKLLRDILNSSRGSGKKRRGKKLKISLKKGALTKFGYHIDLPANQRHEALARSVRKNGYATTLKRVVLLRTYNKSRSYLRKKVDSDIKWLQRYYGSKKRSRKYSKKRSRKSKKRSYSRSKKRSKKRSSKKRSRARGFQPVDPREFVKNYAKKYYSRNRLN
jgi:hypothetical protein